MRTLTLEHAADYLKAAEIQKSLNLGYAIVHQGISEAGHCFVMLNDWNGNTVVTESA